MHPSRPLSLVLLGLVVAAAVAGCATEEAPGAATVVRVVDGHTVQVDQDGTATSVRLLGVAAPVADECLAAESAEALTGLLPVGADVRVEVGDPAEGADEVTAAVYVDDVLVNAELARLGLGLSDAEPDGEVAAQIAQAEAEAVDAGVGLFGTDEACTVPAQVAALEQAGTQAADAAAVLSAGVGIAEVDRHAAAIAAATATGAALAALIDGEQSARYPDTLLADLRARTGAVNERLLGVSTSVAQVRASEDQRIEAERVAAEAVAAQAAADEAARQAQAAADAEAARVAAEAAAAKAAQAEKPAAPSGGSVSYKNCDAVRAAGADPIYAGEPGYSSKLDRDGDGVACEK